MEKAVYFTNDPASGQRSKSEAIKRGFMGKCPNCGHGKLFTAYVKVADSCDHCEQELHHHRADDLPAYLVIAIIGKVIVSGFIAVEMAFELTTFQHLMIWIPLTIIMSLGLLQPVKGAVVGLQWALKMNGFGDDNSNKQLPSDHLSKTSAS